MVHFVCKVQGFIKACKRHERCFVLVLQALRNRKQNKKTSFFMVSDKPFVCKVIFFQKCLLQSHSDAFSSIVFKYNRRERFSKKKKKVAMKSANSIARTTNSPKHFLPLKIVFQKRKDKLFPMCSSITLMCHESADCFQNLQFLIVKFPSKHQFSDKCRLRTLVTGLCNKETVRYLTSQMLLSLGSLRGVTKFMCDPGTSRSLRL